MKSRCLVCAGSAAAAASRGPIRATAAAALASPIIRTTCTWPFPLPPGANTKFGAGIAASTRAVANPTPTSVTVEASYLQVRRGVDVTYTATVNPNKSYEVTVTARLTITRRDGSAAAPIVLTRMATAGYQVGAQIINDQASFTEASERAARSAAESLRLAVLAALMR